MKQIDFTRLPINDIDGNENENDVSKFVGNFIFNMADDVAEHDLGIKIYHSAGTIDIDEKEEKILKKYLPALKYNLRSAIEQLLSK